MKTKQPPTSGVRLVPRLRVMRGTQVALGPGRVDLLELIGQTGSLRAAARRMGASYMRAWTLVRDTNRWFNQPLVESVRGGNKGGGAVLTQAGRQAVALYRRMEKKSQAASRENFRALRPLLKH